MASVTVMGAGIFGLSCAWEMARRGARVTVIEAQRIGAGSSGGHVGALAPHTPENWNPKKAFQLDSLLMADGWWAAVQMAGGRDPGFARTGRLQPLNDPDSDLLAARLAAAGRRWPFEMRVIRTPASALVPASPSGRWLYDGLTARIAPRAALTALAGAIAACGGRIIEGGGTPRHGDAVLWATGAAGLVDMGAGVGIKGQSALLRFDAAQSPQVFAEALHIVPHGDGTVAIGSTSERDFADTAPDMQAQDLVARARAICPALHDAPLIEYWAGIRPRAQSRAPVLGAWPGRAGHFVANGGFKIGFGMGPKIAEVMADLILAGTDTIPDGFRFHGAGDTPIT